MKFISTLAAASALVAGAAAQATNGTDFATGLLAALRANNLTTLADIVGNNSAQLVPALDTTGNLTVLAPTDAAFAALPTVPTGAELVGVISYHVLNGTWYANTTGVTIAPTLLKGQPYVRLPNNRSQVVVLNSTSTGRVVSQINGTVPFALNSTNGPVYRNILVQPIGQVLSVPGNLSTVAASLNATQLATLLTQTNLLTPLENSAALTVFAPTDAAIQNVSATIAAASPEQQTAVLANHVINGTVVYSPSLTANGGSRVASAITGSGQNITFSVQNGAVVVTSGNVTARVVKSDVLANNGVVHVIDNVLLNTANNAQAAQAAATSNSASFATNTAAPGVATNAVTASGGSSGSGGNANAAATTLISGAALAVAGVASGLWLLA